MNKRRALKQLREQIKHSETLTDQDRENLIRFDDQMALLRSEYSVSRREKHLRACSIMAGQARRIPQEELPNIELSAALKSRHAAEELVRWINERYENEETNKDYRTALRMFGKRVTTDDSLPEALEWIPTTTSRSYSPTPDPATMLQWDTDVLPLIKQASPRTAALVAVAWDAGPRPGELLDLKISNITDHRHGLQITVEGKKGQRTITLIPSVPYVNRWLSEHPFRNDPSAPLWCKKDNKEAPTHQSIWKELKNLANRANISKPVTLTNFRKSSASYLASRNMNQAHLEDRFGWTRGSNIASRYIAIFNEKSDNELAKIYGLEIESDESDRIAPLVCPRCEKETPREEEFCVWCHQVLDPESIPKLKEQEQQIRRAVLKLAQESPETIDHIEKAETMMQIFDSNPELHRAAQRYLSTLSETE